MQIPVPNYKQGDPRWGSQLLGSSDVNLRDYGCAITCVAMIDSKFDPANPWNPGQVDEWFTNHNGYVQENLVAWDRINGLLPNTLWQGADWTPNTPAPIEKLKRHLDSGGLAILEVRFGGNPNLMHFVVAVGYNGDDIIYNDPYVGDTAAFSNGRFGSGLAYADILSTHYFIDTTPDVPNPPPVAPVEVPVQPAPAPAPETPPAPSPEPPENEATPPDITTIPESGKPETPQDDPLPIPEVEPEAPADEESPESPEIPTSPPLNQTTTNDWEDTFVDKLRDVFARIADELDDIAFRAAKTFVQSAAAVLLATNQPLSKAALVAALAAGISAVWNSLKAAKKE